METGTSGISILQKFRDTLKILVITHYTAFALLFHKGNQFSSFNFEFYTIKIKFLSDFGKNRQRSRPPC